MSLWAFGIAGALLAFSIWKRRKEDATTTTRTDKFADYKNDKQTTIIPTQEKTVIPDLAEMKK